MNAQRLLRLACCSIAITAASLPAFAQPATSTAPASAPVALRAFITGVEGMVQVRMDEGAAWQKATVGMELGGGAEFRTGPRSAVRFEIPPDQVITLDRLGTCKLVDAVRVGKVVKTDLGMKYGRVRYDIEAAGQTYDAKIHSPGAALAVRGTRFSLYNQPPYNVEAVSLTGAVELRNARRQRIAFGGRRRAAVSGEQTSAAQGALASSQLANPELQRTEQQLRELTFLFDNQGEALGNVATSSTPVTDAQLPRLFGENRLNFVLRWSDREASDLNLFVRTPLEENFGNPPFIFSFFPGNREIGQELAAIFPPTTPSGGQIGLNHIGPEGIEIGSFGQQFPDGIYIVSAYNFIFSEKPLDTTGLPRVPFSMEVFVDGQRQPLITNLREALAGKERPECGLVYTDTLAIGELAFTAVRLGPEGPICEIDDTSPPKSNGGRNRVPQVRITPVERHKPLQGRKR